MYPMLSSVARELKAPDGRYTDRLSLWKDRPRPLLFRLNHVLYPQSIPLRIVREKVVLSFLDPKGSDFCTRSRRNGRGPLNSLFRPRFLNRPILTVGALNSIRKHK